MSLLEKGQGRIHDKFFPAVITRHWCLLINKSTINVKCYDGLFLPCRSFVVSVRMVPTRQHDWTTHLLTTIVILTSFRLTVTAAKNAPTRKNDTYLKCRIISLMNSLFWLYRSVNDMSVPVNYLWQISTGLLSLTCLCRSIVIDMSLPVNCQMLRPKATTAIVQPLVAFIS